MDTGIEKKMHVFKNEKGVGDERHSLRRVGFRKHKRCDGRHTLPDERHTMQEVKNIFVFLLSCDFGLACIVF